MVVYRRMPKNIVDLINWTNEEEVVARKERVFIVGDLVMVHLRKGHFLARTYSKLRKRNLDHARFCVGSTTTRTSLTYRTTSTSL